ncbi:MAG TPA: hypothetical protein VJ547_03520 [Candidatus Thermoplasmatota archaeon]|nr:hypothetical protein [Candidatus Thermoplasmatota archaeon]
MTGGLDPTPARLEAEHEEFARGFARAAALPDRTGLAAGDLDLELRTHIAREELARLALASVHFARAEGPPPETTPLEKARVAEALKALQGFRAEHEKLRARVDRARAFAEEEGHGEVALLCRRLLGHIALEDGLVHRLSMVEARAFLAVARGPAGP